MFRSEKWDRAMRGTAVPSQQRAADAAERKAREMSRSVEVKGRKASSWRLPKGRP